jgi:hypothetical protein
MFTNEEVDDEALIERIRRILLPFEYTRVDNIVDLVFETQQESDQKTTADLESQDSTQPTDQEGGVREFTPGHELETKRAQIVSAFFKSRSLIPIKRTRTNFSDSMNKIGITCVCSRRRRSRS